MTVPYFRWFLLLTLMAFGGVTSAENWPAWRGPRGDGTCSEQGLPTTWSRTENVAWKVALPERGNSTPIVWNDRVFITQTLEREGRRTLMCFDRQDGRLLWQEGTAWPEKEPTHGTNPACSASPVTDGERVVAWFGSAGLFCYDLQGTLLWKRDLGVQRHVWGYGSSPLLHGDLCFLNFGPGERSFLIAVNKRTGETIWQHDEPINRQGTSEAKFSNADYYGSWSTPLICDLDGRSELIISFPFRVCSFDATTGRQRWTCSGINPLIYTSPIVADDIVVAMGGYGGMSVAVKTGGSGDGTKEIILSSHTRTKQRIGTGTILNGVVYVNNYPGIAECFDLRTGQLVWEQRMTGEKSRSTNWSSVMIADGLCYTMTQGGDCFVFRAGPQFELVAVNSLGEPSNASPAASDGQLFLRTDRHLWCIGDKRRDGSKP